MLVISDTSVVCNLAIIGRLEALRLQHSTVVIPAEVEIELMALKLPHAVASIESAKSDGWLVVTEPTKEERAFALTLELDEGEAQAISIARLRHADKLCIDESDGRTVARRLGISIVGVIGILLAEKHAGRVTSIKECIEMLQDDAGFFMSKRLIEDALRLAGE
ncbi:MAG: DUF3368 domain-containing protein [Prosthecobacter sp.]